MSFSEFNFQPGIVEGISAMGFNEPTDVQRGAIPAILSGKDVIACAQTGTGKTAAYLLPILNSISERTDKSIHTLIVVPTRELAVQIDQQVDGFSYFLNVSSATIYGGKNAQSFEAEKNAITEGVDILIATPGRLLTHFNLGYVDVSGVKNFVLDEADRMLDMGFNEDIMKIHDFLPKKKQTLFFSATMPPKIRKLANSILHEPEQINIAISKPAEGVDQSAYVVYDSQKEDVTAHLLKEKDYKSVIIFSSTKSTVKNLTSLLKTKGLQVEAIHSDLEQTEREQVLQQFKNKKIHVLVATDIISRGIDIEDIEMVVNYDVPNDVEDYIHRIGRTARASSKGRAVTMIGQRQQREFHQIEQFLDKTITKNPVPGELGKTPEYNPTTRSQFSHKRKPSFNKNRR